MFQKNETGDIRPLEPDDRAASLPKYRRWTFTSVNCYRRGCRCGEGPDFPECGTLQYCAEPHANFIIKQVVIKLVRELGTQSIETDIQYGKETDYGGNNS